MPPFDVCINLAPIKYNKHAVHDDVLSNKVMVFIFSRVYEITFQNTNHQKFVSLVIESLNRLFQNLICDTFSECSNHVTK